jgi:DNA-binding SARP family transcriptional activator
MSIEVLTLGDFDIKRSGKSLMERNKRSHKRLELLKYFITYRDKKLSPEYIAENLWNDSEYADPKNTLRTQIFRLRKTLDGMGINGNAVGDVKYLDIAFQNGYYVLNIGENCLVDAVLFEKNIKIADKMRSDNPDEAIGRYIEAIRLYRGEYLADIAASEWVFTIRNRYHRLYVQSLIRLFELLKSKGRCKEIVEHFEQAVCYEPFEEALHVFFLEALLDLKEYKNALSHYNYITGRMYRELSVKPSPALKGIYSKIVAGEKNIQKADLSTLSKSFTYADDMEGALFCDIEYFRTIYNLEERRSIRAQTKEFLGLVTVTADSGEVSNDKLGKIAETLKSVLKDSLRRGDVYTQWNNHQMIVLLTDVQQDALVLISRRILKKFNSTAEHNGISVDISFKPITSDKKPFFA